MELVAHIRRVGRDVVAYGAIAALSRVGGLVLLPVLTRVFSAAEYGVIDLFAASVALLALFIRLALPSAISRYFHELERPADRAGLISNCLLLVGGCGVGLTGASWLVGNLVHAELPPPLSVEIVVLGVAASSVLALASIAEAVLRVQRQILQYNAVSLLNTTVYVGLALWWVLAWTPTLEAVFAAQLAGAAVGAVLGLWLIRDWIRIERRPALLRTALSFGIPLIPAVLVSWANEQTDRIILLSLQGLASVTIYAVAAKIAMIFLFVVAMFRQAWQPYSMTLVASAERDAMYRLSLDTYMALSCTLGLAFMIVGPVLFTLLIPTDYAAGMHLLPWLVGAAVMHHSLSISSLGVIVSERTRHLASGSVLCVLSNVAISIPLIHTIGVTGAAIGTFIAQFGLSFLMLNRSNRESGVAFQLRGFLWPTAIFVIAAPATLYLRGALPHGLSWFAQALLLSLAAWLMWTQGLAKNSRTALLDAIGIRRAAK